MLTFQKLQKEHKAWSARNFPDRDASQSLLGIMEEVGELAHSHLKCLQKIRGTDEQHHFAKIDAVGDIVVFLSDYCTASGIDFQSAVEDTWNKVKHRDWVVDPEAGGD